jgi:hypothetical protein
MPIITVELDNMFPPTWQATGGHVLPEGANTYTDPTTAVRWIVGNDKLNYWNFQRALGDLFARDFALSENIDALNDYLNTNTGICFNMPVTQVWPGNYVEIGSFKLTESQNPIAFLVAADVKIVDGPQLSTLQLIVQNVTDDVQVLSVDSVTRAGQTYFAAAAIQDFPPWVPCSKLMSVRVINTGTVPVHASGCLIWNPSVNQLV